MPTLNIQNASLYYEITGEGEIPLFFIHGMCGNGGNWDDQVRRLSDRFTCVAYDRRGHSRSADDIENQGDLTHANDAVALINALNLDRPIIVASSGGAVVAVELLYRHPDAVRGAVLSEPPLFSIDPAAGQELKAELAPEVKEAMERGGPRAAVDAFFELVCSEYWPQIDEARKEQFRDNAPLLLATLQREETTVTKDDLANIATPTLIVTGEKSFPVAQSISQQLAEALPNARLVELEGSGHVTYAERPAAFAEQVSRFANQITGNVTLSARP